jgi:D-arabinose 1-dehydrogenase-like Zn-dependent alcohol dehydrogenase
LKIEDKKISIRNFLTFKELGADDYIAQNDEAAMTAGVKTLDLIIDTIPASHDINPPLNLAKKKGIYVVVGVNRTIQGIILFLIIFFRDRNSKISAILIIPLSKLNVLITTLKVIWGQQIK